MEERNMATGTYEIIYDGSGNIKDITVTGLTEDYKFTECIVTAVDNTYKQGINPEAVPDMLEALKGAYNAIEKLPAELFGVGNLTDANGDEQFYPLQLELLNNIEQALKKAEL